MAGMSDVPACDPGCSPASSPPPTRSTSATTWARCATGWRCRTPTTRSTASSTCTRSPPGTTRRCCASAPGSRAAQLLAVGLDPERCTLFVQSQVPEHAAARLGAGLHHRLRRGQPDDPVQGQVGQAGRRPGQRRPVHLPDPAGRRHPALPGRRGAGRRGPAPAPGADPRPRAAVQHARSARRSRVPEPYIIKDTAKITDLQDPTAKMSKSASSPTGHRRAARRPGADRPRRSSRAVTDTGREIVFDPETKPGVSNLLTIYSALTGRAIDDLVDGVRRQGLRRPEEGPGRGRGRVRRARSRSAPRRTSTTRRSSTSCSRSAPRRRARSPSATLREVYDRVGLPRAGDRARRDS